MKILKPMDVTEKVGLSRVTIWRMERAGTFPKRVNLSPGRVGWKSDEIDEWIETRPRGICGREIGKEVGA